MSRTLSPLQSFIRAESAGGITLSVGALIGLLWSATSSNTYASVWTTSFHALGGHTWHLNSGYDIVSNGLLTFFFLAVGLELTREVTSGHLSTPLNAALPAVAALMGMIATAGAALALGALSSTHALSRGWGVPMATDIAFALGALALVGKRIPRDVRIFLLTLAIADDVLSVVALAASHPHGVRPLFLLALFPVVALSVMWRRAPRSTLALTVLAAWMILALANVEPCLAGVIAGLCAPRRHAHVIERVEEQVALSSTWVVLPIYAIVACGVDWSKVSFSGSVPRFALLLLVARWLGKVPPAWDSLLRWHHCAPSASPCRCSLPVSPLASAPLPTTPPPCPCSQPRYSPRLWESGDVGATPDRLRGSPNEDPTDRTTQD